MTHTAADIAAARHRMVDDLVERRCIQTRGVENAFRSIPRHTFVSYPCAIASDPRGTEFEETDNPCLVYSDVPIAHGSARITYCGAPSLMARAIESLDLVAGMRVLHLGCGLGYYTAIIAELVGERGTVVATECQRDIAEVGAALLAQAGYTTVTLRHGDAVDGVPEAAPFDAVVVSTGAADIAPPWIAQLAPGGRVVLPLCEAPRSPSQISAGALCTIERSKRALFGRLSRDLFFIPLSDPTAAAAARRSHVAHGLERWFALAEVLQVDPQIRIAMKGVEQGSVPAPASVPWFLETGHAFMWIEPN